LLIADTLADRYAFVSSDTNYDKPFLLHKRKSESSPIPFDPSPEQQNLSYNLPISAEELSIAISENLRNASPGQDSIHATMLENLHLNLLTYFLSLFNSIFSQNTYPLTWKTVIILSILKPSSDPLLPSSYRTIALSSVLGKLFQKILNKGLLWFLEANNLLSPFHYGFGKGRNTIQALTDLQYEIKEAAIQKSALYSIFFDLQEAFSRVWRYYILFVNFTISVSVAIYHNIYFRASSKTENYQFVYKTQHPPQSQYKMESHKAKFLASCFF